MKQLGRGLAIFLAALVLWAGFTDNPAVWPVRSTLEYHLTRNWWKLVGEPDRDRLGSIAGRVYSETGQPVPHANVVVSEWDGRVHIAKTDDAGIYILSGVPAGFYRVAVAANGFAEAQTGGILRGITVRPDSTAEASFRLNPAKLSERSVLPPPAILDTQTLHCTSPVPGSAVRSTLKFGSGGRQDLVFLYRPPQTESKQLPILLTVYPGPVDTWECVSIGLSQAGYAVLAVGPEYRLDLHPDVEWLADLLTAAQNGELPGTDPSRMAALGGSYSALLLEMLMLQEPDLLAVVLLGPPADLFDFRRRFEREGFVPPFGLDKALVALGLPNREPLRYLTNSMVYHVRPNLPATVIFHSYQDEIVPYQQSRLLADSMRAKDVEAELHLFDGASHYLLEDGEAALAIYRHTLDFLGRHGMAPFPGKGK